MEDNEIFGGLLGGQPVEPETPAETQPIVVELDEEELTIRHDEVLYEPGNRVLTARMELFEAQQANNKLQDVKTQLERQAAEIRRRFDAEMRENAMRLEIVKADLWDMRKKINAIRMEVAQAENALRTALMNLKTKREFMENAKAFDTLTLNMPWREWALEHQLDGAKFLATAKRGILADKMGLGKTLTSLITADMLGVKRLLIVVPDDVVNNFAREVAHWAPHRTSVVLGKRSKGEREAILTVVETLQEFTVLINYSAWRKDQGLLKKLAGLRFEMAILDEAHTIKTTSTSAFKGCKEIVLAENSCPECRGKIQRIYDPNSNAAFRNLNRYVPREYYACVGHDAKVIAGEIRVDEVNLSKACGWSQLKDIVDDTDREHGSLRSCVNLIPMTGTPILNSPTDLFPLLNLLNDAIWHNANEFVREYCVRDTYSNRIFFKPGGLDSLVKSLSSKYIGRDRDSAGVVLPKQEIRYHDIEFDRDEYPDQYRIIKQLTRHAAIMRESGQALPILAIIALITRKRQANVWPAGIRLQYEDADGNLQIFEVGDEVRESIKLDYIIKEPERAESGEWEGMVPDLTGMGDMINGERVVIFSQFKTPLAELERRMRSAGINVVRFDGDTKEDVREQVKVDFDRRYLKEHPDYEPKWQVVLANYKTGGVGLNFTGCTQTIVLDEEWNPGKNEQAYGRTDRIGQTEESIVHVLRLAGTVDQWLADLIAEKADIIEGFKTNIEANDLLSFLAKEDFE